MANRQRTSVRSQARPAQRRSAQRSENPRTSPPEKFRRLRVSAAEAQRLRALLLSDEVGLIGSQDIRKLVTILEDVYPTQRPRRPHWQPLLLGLAIGLVIIAGILLAG